MFDLIIFLSLVALGYFVGSQIEKRHYRSINEREMMLLYLPAVTMKHVDDPSRRVQAAELVCGSAVISVDYFKRILAGLRNIFGRTVRSYESLIDRARREAMLRMKEAATGATVIINVRIETSTIGRNAGKGVGCVEAFAYGTAVKLE